MSQIAVQNKELKDLQIDWVANVEQESDTRWLVKMEADKLKKICKGEEVFFSDEDQEDD